MHRVAIVTGASRGIGRAIALELGKHGLSVLVNFAGSVGDAEATVRTIADAGGIAESFKADVSSAAEVVTLFDKAEQRFGAIDVLVNNAGVMAPSKLAEAADADFVRHFAINVRGSFYAMREAARRLREDGRIINLSSTTLALNAPGYGIYNATKGAIEGFTRVLAKELGPRRITVNAVAPGPVETELFMNGKTDAEVARLASLAPQGRLGQPEDIASLVAFLASPEAGWISGQIIRANGGIA